MRPKAFIVSSAIFAQSASFETSVLTWIARVPRRSTSAQVCFIGSTERAASTIFAPAAAYFSAICLPIP